MEDNNFVQKFDVNQKSNSKQIFSAILISFISAIIGGACALGIYLGIANNPKEETVDTSTSNINNNSYASSPNLSQVSLSNYSDTAIYAAQKVLPSMVSIKV